MRREMFLFLALLCWINYSGQILLHTWLKESKNAHWRTHCALLSYGTNYISHTMIHGQFANGKNLFHSSLRINPPHNICIFSQCTLMFIHGTCGFHSGGLLHGHGNVEDSLTASRELCTEAWHRAHQSAPHLSVTHINRYNPAKEH